tara:strand:- start:59 stop:1180 length:1122 start_codon:yes stop_codon:yes gene_type:complete
MALIISEEQKMLKESAAELLKIKSPVNNLRNLRDQNYIPYDKSLWNEMVEMGWTALIIPEKFNGLNFGYVGLGQILEETGKTLCKSPLISSCLLSSSVINLCDNEFLKAREFPLIMNGKKTITLAIEENSYHKPYDFKTRAKLEGENYIINGLKTFVIDGSTSDEIILVSKVTKNEIGFFIIKRKQKGIEIKNNILLDSGTYSDIKFNDVIVPMENRVNIKINGEELLKDILAIAYSGLASEMLGVIMESFDITVNYLKERQQFGVPIGSYQALQHRAAKIFSEIQLCKSIVIKSLQSIDQGNKERFKYSHLAKAKLGKTIKLVTNEAIQMHGGIGVTDDADIGFYMKRARVLQQLFGDYNFHLDKLANINKY